MSNRRAEQIPVKVHVKTDIQNGLEKETYEFTTFGRYYQKGSAVYLQYDEVMEEGVIKTTVKMSQAEGVIIRNGAVKMKLSFKLNQKLNGIYESPYGTLQLNTFTRKLQSQFQTSTNIGLMEILYELYMNGSLSGIYQMKITFEEEKNEHR
ncbi:DUF1934 domain-containing protein [Bacillus sp. 03113]|uniref:DUF1934 domain-containing protein n=1 Tax=Bacillus sp. 03113 TaxID=2578211 RepID=UPI001143FC5A|nr:DUF1934 domain-containing protein [Bacillus sp. 03113]